MMSPRNDERLDRLLDDWVAREVEAAPELTPPEALRRRVVEGPSRAPARRVRRMLPWVLAAAGLAGLAIGLRALFFPPGPSPDEESLRLVAWHVEPGTTFRGAVLERRGPKEGPARGPEKGGRGAKGGPASFSRLIFQRHRPGSRTVNGIDLLRTPRENPVLAPGDRYRLGLTTAGDRHVYVFQIHPPPRRKLGVVRLFPNAAYAPAENPLRRGASHYLPAAPNWFSLPKMRGEERIYVVAAREPLPELEAFLRLDPGTAAASIRRRLESLQRQPSDGVEVVVLVINESPR